MPGPVSESRKGPRDFIPFGPRWAYPHLNNSDYLKLKRLHEEAQKQKPTKKINDSSKGYY